MMHLPVVMMIAFANGTSFQPAAPNLVATLVEGIGLGCDTLAAVGAEQSQVFAIVGALRESTLSEQFAQLQIQIQAAEAAQVETDLSGGDETGIPAETEVALGQLRAQRATVVVAARDLVKAQLSTSQAAAVQNWWAAAPFLPLPMRVRAWSDVELKSVRDALLAEKTGTERGEEVPSEDSSLLASVRAEAAVAAASGNLVGHTADAAAWLNTALNPSN